MAWARADSADLDSPHVIDRLPAFWPSSWSDLGRIDSPSGRGRSLFCAGADLLVVPLVGAAAAVEPLGVLGVPVPASKSFLPVPGAGHRDRAAENESNHSRGIGVLSHRGRSTEAGAWRIGLGFGPNGRVPFIRSHASRRSSRV